MSFQQLKVDELKDVAEFFAVDVEVANEEHGPTKKELLAALAAGDEPVTWDDYNNVYLVAKKAEAPADPVVEEDEPEADKAPQVQEQAQAERDLPRTEPKQTPIIVKFEGKNPRYEVVGLVFTASHPFQPVDPETAEYLVRNQDGRFRLAMPSEVSDYYGQ